MFLMFLGGITTLLPFGLLAVFAYDRLVRRLHELHPNEWRTSGGPRGWFWKPPGGLLPTSNSAFVTASMSWAFRLPAAIASDQAARRAQYMLRLGLIIWNIGIVS